MILDLSEKPEYFEPCQCFHVSRFGGQAETTSWSFSESGTITSIVLKFILLTYIDKIKEIELTIKAVICDHGSNNRSMISKLGVIITEDKYMSWKYVERFCCPKIIMYLCLHLHL